MNDMIKVYQERLYEYDEEPKIWLNDLLDEEGIPYQNQILESTNFIQAFRYR